jgi:pyridoxine kinase
MARFAPSDSAGGEPVTRPKVIVVTSHVARGAVGGRAAVFALERVGFEVVFVPTVLLPWHPGQGPGTRIVPEVARFDALLADLERASWLGSVGGVLTGYFGEAAEVAPAARLISAVKSANPGARYLCDPVCGDGDTLFVPEATAAAIRDLLLPRADILTPNRFETGWLAGEVAAGNDGLADAARKLGAGETVVTSAFAPEGSAGVLVMASGAAHLVSHPSVPAAPHGTGDLFAALHLAHRLDGVDAVRSAARALASVSALVALAVKLGVDELPLAAGQDFIVAPPDDVTIAPL